LISAIRPPRRWPPGQRASRLERRHAESRIPARGSWRFLPSFLDCAVTRLQRGARRSCISTRQRGEALGGMVADKLPSRRTAAI